LGWNEIIDIIVWFGAFLTIAQRSFMGAFVWVAGGWLVGRHKEKDGQIQISLYTRANGKFDNSMEGGVL